MNQARLRTVIRQMRGALRGEGEPDAELVERFVRDRDEAAFELLLWRHAALVMGVCRRVLRHEQDAEDAFQATFLAFARKAAAVGRRESVGHWLYKVAYRCALAARAAAVKRREQEARSAVPDIACPQCDLACRELRALVDAEINCLPERYRGPFVLCCLEGRTMQEAAEELGCPLATVGTRVRRARERLHARLARRGVALSAGGLAAGGEVPRSLVSAALKAASPGGSGALAVGGAVPARVVCLTEGVLRGMWAKKLIPVVTAVLIGLSGIGLASRGLSHGQAGQEKPAGSAEGDGKAKQERARLKAVLASAVESTDGIEELNPKVWALLGIARVQARAGQRDDAAATIRLAVKAVGAHKDTKEGQKGNKAHRMKEVAECQAETGDVQAALKTAQGIEQDDSRASALAAIAVVQARAGDFKGAVKTADQIKDNDLRRGEALSGIATAHAEARDFKAAHKTAALIGHDVSKALALVAIAVRQARAKDAEGAARVLADALALATKAQAPDVVAAVAGAHTEAGEIEKAKRTAKGIADAGARGGAWRLIAVAQAARGDPKAALRTAALIKDDDRKGEALKEVVAVMARSKDVAGAARAAEAIKSDLWRFYALLEVAKGQARAPGADPANRALEKAAKEVERLGNTSRYSLVKPYALANLAGARAACGREKQALEWARKQSAGLTKAMSLMRIGEALVDRAPDKREK